ncbi:MarR family transcriptional regulator [Catenulispora sp. NF23]|uniref:MarR family winged helix-turn-helix transcriptional regulator n=1 Tax=Catenulispora pinistramenti TaxID=2705254 RepID=UPI001BA71B1C|nr:MarR family transcriptional regulator [Catenulispora pinistramenti]MBS2538235.1 MarR family transcriptional regulator [Catenulispora pinistramenti]
MSRRPARDSEPVEPVKQVKPVKVADHAPAPESAEPTDPAPTAPTATTSDITDALAETAFTVTALLAESAAAHDLSLTQLRMLAILRDREPRIADLAAFLGLERSSVSGLVDRAVRRGLVHRTASADDARATRLTLTDEGRRLAAVVTAQVDAKLVPITGRLATAERARLVVLLRKLLD